MRPLPIVAPPLSADEPSHYTERPDLRVEADLARRVALSMQLRLGIG